MSRVADRYKHICDRCGAEEISQKETLPSDWAVVRHLKDNICTDMDLCRECNTGVIAALQKPVTKSSELFN